MMKLSAERFFRRHLRGVFLLLFFPSLSYAQFDSPTYVRAEEAFYQEDFETAKVYFAQELEDKPTNRKARYFHEICSFLTTETSRSMDKFLEIGKIYGRNDKFYSYWLGRIYAKRYEFQKAIESWKNFLLADNYKSQIIINEVKEFLMEAERQKVFLSDTTIYHVFQLPTPVNSQQSEENPCGASGSDRGASRKRKRRQRRPRFGVSGTSA